MEDWTVVDTKKRTPNTKEKKPKRDQYLTDRVSVRNTEHWRSAKHRTWDINRTQNTRDSSNAEHERFARPTHYTKHSTNRNITHTNQNTNHHTNHHTNHNSTHNSTYNTNHYSKQNKANYTSTNTTTTGPKNYTSRNTTNISSGKLSHRNYRVRQNILFFYKLKHFIYQVNISKDYSSIIDLFQKGFCVTKDHYTQSYSSVLYTLCHLGENNLIKKLISLVVSSMKKTTGDDGLEVVTSSIKQVGLDVRFTLDPTSKYIFPTNNVHTDTYTDMYFDEHSKSQTVQDTNQCDGDVATFNPHTPIDMDDILSNIPVMDKMSISS